MRKLSFVAILLISMSNIGKCQIVNYGVSPQFNIATQLIRNPAKPEDGTMQGNSLNSFGVATFIEFHHFQYLNSIIRLGYSRKGFTDPIQLAVGNGVLKDMPVKNSFDYLNLDLLGKKQLFRKRKNPYVIAGLEASYLLKNGIPEPPAYSIIIQYPDYSKYKKLSLGYIVGLGFEVEQLLSMDFSMNMDFLVPVRTDVLFVRNWIWTAEMNVNINNLIEIFKN